MINDNFLFIIIDDNVTAKRPLLIEAKEKYGNEHVKLFNKKKDADGTPDEGLTYILKNLGKGINGFEMLKKIREKSGLVFFIFTTGQKEKISFEQWTELVNTDALFFIQNTELPKEKLDLVDKALRQMETRIDCTMESWIAALDEEDRKKPIMASRQGQQWSFDDILREIREHTNEGTRIEKNIITLTLDLITRGKRTIDA
jgi:cell division inhibitor SulA